MQNEKVIIEQIGSKALYMIGAKNIVAGQNEVSFKIARNAKSVNHVVIKLNSMDLYDVTFGNIRGVKYTVKCRYDGIFGNMLNSVIERATGLYTSL